jgi:E3 ubiquitin-protein ligase synoviolin
MAEDPVPTDPPPLAEESEEERRRREQEEEMERIMLQQEQEDLLLQQEQEDLHRGGPLDNNEPINNNGGNDNLANDNEIPDDQQEIPAAAAAAYDYSYYATSINRLSYTQASLGAALALLWYALRTRQQWYLALVYIRSSKFSYIVLANALVALCVGIFRGMTKTFLGGLRLHEAEGLGDFFRWNVTETCLALTMFRSELTVSNGILFLLLVLAKCLHWVADLREGHLRVTDESIVTVEEGFWKGWPKLQRQHVKLWLLLIILQIMDILAVQWCGNDILTHGPSVSILFGFEGAILLVTAWNNLVLWHLHALDGWMHYLHEQTTPQQRMHRWIHPWKEHKATFVFAVEVQAQAAKFLFYVTFFAIVLTYYGMPINLFREVYVSFQALKQRLVAFAKYRRLMASMNRFQSVNQEELEEAGVVCIICRDEMTVNDSKKLPGCGHVFHKS